MGGKKGNNAHDAKASGANSTKSEGKNDKGKKAKDSSGGSGYTKVKVRHILCSKLSKATEALTKINE